MFAKLKQWMCRKTWIQEDRIRELEEESQAYMEALTEACEQANQLQKDLDKMRRDRDFWADSTREYKTESKTYYRESAKLSMALQESEKDFATLQRQYAGYRAGIEARRLRLQEVLKDWPTTA